MIVNAGHLHACCHCGLYFRHPYPSGSALLKAYSEITSDRWVYQERSDFKLAQQALFRFFGEGKVLDVGCFRGDFLSTLPQAYSRYGIEPSPDACKEAQQRHVHVIAKSIESIDASISGFHAITMLDVVEHLPHPVHALEKLVGLLEPGGVLIVATGNTNALPWRLLRLGYWYYFPEHVSFFNRRWFDWFSRKSGLEVVSIVKFSHFRASIAVRLWQLLQAVAYVLVKASKPQSMYARILCSIYPFSRVDSWGGAPITKAWKDHMLVVLRKGSSA